jgi:hypothetical protein
MKKLLLSGLLALTAAVSAEAGYIESYTARLIDRDHYNSNGERLESAAAIIRQNRANFYVYGIRTDEDEPDAFFSRKSNRALLEQFLEHGAATQEAKNEIINGTPLIRVDVYTERVDVTVLSGGSQNRTDVWKDSETTAARKTAAATGTPPVVNDLIPLAPTPVTTPTLAPPNVVVNVPTPAPALAPIVNVQVPQQAPPVVNNTIVITPPKALSDPKDKVTIPQD